jgi:hypothetical protein
MTETEPGPQTFEIPKDYREEKDQPEQPFKVDPAPFGRPAISTSHPAHNRLNGTQPLVITR